MLKNIMGIVIGGVLGLLLPYGIAFLNVFSFLGAETPYETVTTYMIACALFGAVVGGLLAYKMGKKHLASA